MSATRTTDKPQSTPAAATPEGPPATATTTLDQAPPGPATPVALEGLPSLLKAIFELEGEARALLLVGLYAGLGRDELVALRWDRLSLDEGTVRFAVQGSAGDLTLPLAAPLRDLLAERREVDPDGVFVFPGRRPGTARVGTRSVAASVAKAAGVPFRIDGVPAIFRALAAQASVPDDMTAWLARDDVAARVASLARPDIEELRAWVDAVAAQAAPPPP